MCVCVLCVCVCVCVWCVWVCVCVCVCCVGCVCVCVLCCVDTGPSESWEYDSGARDLLSPDLQSPTQTHAPQQSSPLLQKLLDHPSALEPPAGLHKLLSQHPSGRGGSYLELANTVSLPLIAPGKNQWIHVLTAL